MAKDKVESPELEQDLEIARTVLAAYGRAVTDGEIDALLELLDREVDLEFPSAIQGAVKLSGHEEARRYLKAIASEYIELRLLPREFRSLDRGRLLVIGRWQGRAHGGGTPFGTPLALILELREGKVACLRGFMDEQLALEAARGG